MQRGTASVIYQSARSSAMGHYLLEFYVTPIDYGTWHKIWNFDSLFPWIIKAVVALYHGFRLLAIGRHHMYVYIPLNSTNWFLRGLDAIYIFKVWIRILICNSLTFYIIKFGKKKSCIFTYLKGEIIRKSTIRRKAHSATSMTSGEPSTTSEAAKVCSKPTPTNRLQRPTIQTQIWRSETQYWAHWPNTQPAGHTWWRCTNSQ